MSPTDAVENKTDYGIEWLDVVQQAEVNISC